MVAAQIRPHAPQLRGSVRVSMHDPAHIARPPGHEHVPLTHVPVPQSRPHTPQFLGSVASRAQAPPQSTKPPVHTHAPAAQPAPTPQTVPQAPQFAGSLPGSTQVVAQRICGTGHTTSAGTSTTVSVGTSTTVSVGVSIALSIGTSMLTSMVAGPSLPCPSLTMSAREVTSFASFESALAAESPASSRAESPCASPPPSSRARNSVRSYASHPKMLTASTNKWVKRGVARTGGSYQFAPPASLRCQLMQSSGR